MPRRLPEDSYCAVLALGPGHRIERCAIGGAPDDTRLNVVLILADDLGWTDLGCFGSDLYRTPTHRPARA